MQKKRQVDNDIAKSLSYFNRLKLVSHSFIKRWRFLLVLLFIVGFVTAVVWMISDKYFYW